MQTTHRLATPTVPPPAPSLDDAQRAVVDHVGGPMLVLAGPGTGKTTTLVEAIVERIEERGVDPGEVLALTFSRKAAEQLRDRVTARLGRTTAAAMASTFHSFAYGLIRRFQPPELYAAPLRLLSAAEQDVVLAELLQESPESVAWPDRLAAARRTRGFAKEVHDLLARAREKGLEAHDLEELGAAAGVAEFRAGGVFLGQYLDVLDGLGALDYADLMRRAVVVAERHREELRQQFRYVFVDEYQDTDPAQVALLQAIAGDGAELVVVGDPHQSIYGFRGADVRGILQFPEAFRSRRGEPAEVVALTTTRRFGARLLRAAGEITRRLPLSGSLPEGAREAFLAPVADVGAPRGRVEVLTYESERAEAEHLADLLRRAHLEDGVPWSRMAVLVRSGRATLPGLRRALGGHGVPVEVAGDETSLVREPAVQPLLGALDAVIHLRDAPTEPQSVDATRAEQLLTSPLGGLDAADLRVLARSLRSRDRARAVEEARPPASSPELLRSAVVEPGFLEGAEGAVVEKASSFVALLHRVRARFEAGDTAEALLWQLWTGTSWPQRLRASAEGEGPGARLAHRDLDALCALFDTAAKTEGQRAHTSVESFLATMAAQEIPADTLAERGIRGDAVRLMTAHRAKGLEWDLVVVAHVQEELWPDLRRRGSLLQPDRIGTHGLEPPVSTAALLAEERRLFYVACTRARTRLVVTAVRSPEDDGEQPSRFVTELGQEIVHRSGRPARPLSLSGLVAELRRTVADPASTPGLRDAAARRLARLARQRVGSLPLVPSADPATWWGTRDFTTNDTPVRPDDEPLLLSASAVSSLLTCPAQWFLEREAGGATPATGAQGFGLVVHAIAERIGSGELDASSDALGTLMGLVDQVWGQMQFRTPWTASRERSAVEAALARFLAWHTAPGARTLVATEQELRVEVELPDGERAVLWGFLDRLELDEAGRVVVVDLKTGKAKPTAEQVRQHPQLALYQYAVSQGALDQLVPGETAEPGGAELVHLRLESRGKVAVQRQEPPVPDDEGRHPVEEQLMTAARALRGETFWAVKGDHCQFCAFAALCPTQQAGTVLS
ncbi:ATP-dependent helicase [Nocardioides daejeonensis]|uniref:ATP-dependent helicase n=1 Tax=Nocardioides daejeonensis TaxID=1046556 RepID=UPI000D742784|nr:ATP-dependent DNA helicase [Nocardioides daejeonensis]